jgi:hypothetical protein
MVGKGAVMMNINHHGKKAVCTIFAAVVLWMFAAHASALPPDPDNAALLYYQAFLLRPQPEDATEAQVSKVLRGAEPDDNVRQYVRFCRETIELAEAAGQMPKCDWGMRYSQGFRVPSPPPLQHASALTSLLEVSAAVLATDGHYRAALARCLTIRRFARHIGDDRLPLHGASVSFDGSSLRAIRHVLGRMPPDADTLAWLESQLAAVQGSAESPARALEMDLELGLQTMRADPNIVAAVRDQLVERAKDNSAKDAIRSLTDEKVVARARDPYAEFLGSALRAMDSNMLYEKKYAEIQRLIKDLKEKFGNDPAARQVITGSADLLVGFYSLQVRHRASSNALKAAIEIYLAMAKTGRLPSTLPDYLPKDPYSGQDFEYQTTAESFVLRCRVKAIDDNKVWQYEFKVRRSDSAESQPSQ